MPLPTENNISYIVSSLVSHPHSTTLSPHNLLNPPLLHPPNLLPKSLYLPPAIQRPPIIPPQTSHNLISHLLHIRIQRLNILDFFPVLELLFQFANLPLYRLAAEFAERGFWGG